MVMPRAKAIAKVTEGKAGLFNMECILFNGILVFMLRE
jgi:hypothetical protein